MSMSCKTVWQKKGKSAAVVPALFVVHDITIQCCVCHKAVALQLDCDTSPQLQQA